MLSPGAMQGVALAADPPAAIDEGQLLENADRALQGRRLVEAAALLDQLPRDLTPDEAPVAALLRAELLLLQGDRPAEALNLLAATPPPLLACRAATARASAYLQLAAPDPARDLLDPLAVECASHSLYWRVRGQVEMARGRPDLARESLQSALALTPADVDLRNDLAVAHVETGDPQAAVALLSGNLASAPGRGDIALNLDYAKGMAGTMPIRAQSDDDGFWSRRLEAAGAGAHRAGRTALAEALYAQALVVRPRYDTDLWRRYTKVSQRHD